MPYIEAKGNEIKNKQARDDDLPDIFRDGKAASAWLAGVLLKDKPACPECGSPRVSAREGGLSFRCLACRRDFSLRAGTVFERSRLPLHMWLRVLRSVAAGGDGVSSTGLGRELGLRQATAWSVIKRIREAGDGIRPLLAAVAAAGAPQRNRPGRLKGEGMAMTRQELAGLIYDGIRDGTLPVGGRLPSERDIASMFGVGRNSVREALIVLETLGFIEVRGKEGIFVRTLSEEECNRSLDVYSAWPTEMLPHVFQVRILLESEAAGLAARNRTKDDMAHMTYCLRELSRICEERPPDWSNQGTHVNDMFHRLVIEAAHNPVLLRIHEGLVRIIKRAYAVFGGDIMVTPLDQWDERIIRGHRIIMEAIESADEKAARDIMRNHLEITFIKLDAFYQKRIKGALHNHAG